LVISYRLDERLGARAPEGDSAVSMRRPRTRVVIVDADLRIVAADEGARELLSEIEMRDPSRLPRVLDAALRAQTADGGRNDDPLTTIPGFAVRSLSLDGREGWRALLLERVCTRENLEAASRRFGLSRREVDVLRLLLEGDSASEIAQRLTIGECTVGDYIKRIFAKTHVRNRSEMIAKVLGWLPAGSATSLKEMVS
jgi:DNA-binding CsgD family transcriptional regulator